MSTSLVMVPFSSRVSPRQWGKSIPCSGQTTAGKFDAEVRGAVVKSDPLEFALADLPGGERTFCVSSLISQEPV